MATVSDVYPVVSGEGFAVPVGWRTNQIAPDWLAKALEERGWDLERTELGESEVRFADGSDAGPLPDPPIQLHGMEKIGSLPVIGFARMASDVLTFKRGKLSVQLVVTETADSWARQWATYILEMGERQAVPMGWGVADECGVTLHDGNLLISATWWIDGLTLGPSRLVKYADSPAAELLSLGPPSP